MNGLLVAALGGLVGASITWLLQRREERARNRRWAEFEARQQARLAEMYAVKRDPYDGRPL